MDQAARATFGEEHLVFDGCLLAEAALPSPPVVGDQLIATWERCSSVLDSWSLVLSAILGSSLVGQEVAASRLHTAGGGSNGGR